MLKIRLVLCVMMNLCIVGCSSYISRYQFEYDKINQNSEQTIKETSFGRYNHVYEDSSSKIYMDIEPSALGIQFENKLETPIHILWDSSKVIIDYERIYKISNRIENISNEITEIKWTNNRDTIYCSILNKTKNKMHYSLDSGLVSFGNSFKYNFSDIGFRNYKDEFINMKWKFSENSILLSLINTSKLGYKIDQDGGRICINRQKEYYLTHVDKSQEKLKLPDTSDVNYYKILALIKLQKADSFYKIKPTIILGKSIYSDEIIPLSNYFLPYISADSHDLEFSSRGFINCVFNVIIPIKIEGKVIKYKFPFRIKDYQILTKG